MDDLSLSTTDYNSVVSILFVGYIGFQVPSNMIIGKISRPALYICLACAAWGVVSALTAAVHNYVGLMMARVALGITEAVFVSPGLTSHVSKALRSGIDAHSIFNSSPVRSST
jgi:MFS family permease